MKSSRGVRASVDVEGWGAGVRSGGGAWDGVGGCCDVGAEGPREAWFVCAGCGRGAGGVAWAAW